MVDFEGFCAKDDKPSDAEHLILTPHLAIAVDVVLPANAVIGSLLIPDSSTSLGGSARKNGTALASTGYSGPVLQLLAMNNLSVQLMKDWMNALPDLATDGNTAIAANRKSAAGDVGKAVLLIPGCIHWTICTETGYTMAVGDMRKCDNATGGQTAATAAAQNTWMGLMVGTATAGTSGKWQLTRFNGPKQATA